MEELSKNQKIIQDDILRYKKNKLASSLALVGLVFNCLYFMLLYSFNSNYFYNLEIGISIILTLVLLLTIFLSSEGVKGYNKTYSIVLTVIAVIQIIRIFITPVMAVQGKSLFVSEVYPDALKGHYFGFELTPVASCIILIVYLVASAGFLVASAVIGWMQATRLQNLESKIASGEIVIADVLNEVEAEEENAKQADNSSEEVHDA